MVAFNRLEQNLEDSLKVAFGTYCALTKIPLPEIERRETDGANVTEDILIKNLSDRIYDRAIRTAITLHYANQSYCELNNDELETQVFSRENELVKVRMSRIKEDQTCNVVAYSFPASNEGIKKFEA